MAFGYVPVDRDQLFLMPPSMRDWLPEGHLVWFVLDVVDRLDTSELHARHPNDGVGRRAYDPDMMLALLLYAYCNGVRSARQIERLCMVDVAFRVLAAGHRPDHSTIARFRQDHARVAQALFVDVLTLCAEVGLTKVGVVAVDGTKIEANASLKANRTRSQLEREVQEMFDEAAQTDAAEDEVFGGGRGDEVPDDLASRGRRGARLDAALKALAEREAPSEAERLERRRVWEERQAQAAEKGQRPKSRPPLELSVEAAETAVASEEIRRAALVRDRADREAAAAAEGRTLPGRRLDPEGGTRLRAARERLARARAAADEAAQRRVDEDRIRVNVTDPDSRIMQNARSAWIQGYNAQAAVNEHGVALAAEVTPEPNDLRQCQPMMAATRNTLDAAGVTDEIEVMLFDAGYLSRDNLTATGPDRLIATGRSRELHAGEPLEGPPPEDADPIDAMAHRLRTPEGRALYSKRQHTIEPVFGDLKHLRRFRTFSRRGLAAVNAEWKLQLAAHNLLKLFRYSLQPT